jgi:glycine cleavage system H protein
MDGFTYSNMFDTKGIEYLAIIAFLILLIPFWIVLNKQAKLAKRIKHALGVLSANILRIPQGLFYSKNHTWTHLERSGSARVGLDDLLVHITGEMNFRNLRDPGQTITKGELLAEFEQEGKRLRIFSPISGKILNFNQSLI